MYKSLLVAVDGSKQSAQALKLACYLAKQDTGEVHIVHAPQLLQHPAVMVWGLGAVALNEDVHESEVIGDKVLEQAVKAAHEHGATHVHAHLAGGEPALAITDQAEKLGVEVIVMGSRGLGNWSGMALGSVSHKVSHSAKCGVITIR